MSTLRLCLEARFPALRCHRAYEISVGPDLFGIWIAEMAFGRIGTPGRTKIRSFARIADATSAVDASLRRRATLPRRIGVAYRVRTVEFEGIWNIAGLPDRLANFMDAVTDGRQSSP